MRYSFIQLQFESHTEIESTNMKESWLLILEKDSMEIYAVMNITQQSKYFYNPRFDDRTYKLGKHDESLNLFKRRSIIVDGFEPCAYKDE